MDHRQRVSLPASVAAINSASIEMSDTVGWNLEQYMTGTPTKYRYIPEMERRCLVSPSQSEST